MESQRPRPEFDQSPKQTTSFTANKLKQSMQMASGSKQPSSQTDQATRTDILTSLEKDKMSPIVHDD